MQSKQWNDIVIIDCELYALGTPAGGASIHLLKKRGV